MNHCPPASIKSALETQSWIFTNSRKKIIYHNLVNNFAFVGYIVCLWWCKCFRQNFRDRDLMSSLCKQLFQISREKGRMSVATEWVSESALSEQVQAQQRATSCCWGNTQSTVNNCWSVNPVKVNKAVFIEEEPKSSLLAVNKYSECVIEWNLLTEKSERTI